MSVTFVCNNCGARHPKWSGKCENCGEWNTLAEQAPAIPSRPASGGSTSKAAQRAQQRVSGNVPMSFADIEGEVKNRATTGLQDVDRVLGGGFVPGMVVLLSGEPGIGKSTLLLQLCDAFSNDGKGVLYASGEESGGQVRLRAQRLGVNVTSPHLRFMHEQDVGTIMQHLADDSTQLLILDSIQTAYTSEVIGEPGNVAQVRGAASRLIEAAKRTNTSVVIVGHVTKGGTLAGPKTLEHLVDTVLQLEGDRSHSFRILRSVKNRFGPTDETGVFEMAEKGLLSVPNPSEFFLAERQEGASGSAVTTTVEGSSVFLVELQAIATPTSFGYPKRTASGFDVNRLQLLIAVLTKVVGLKLGEKDVFFNVVGGVKLSEPAVDLAAALAVASSAVSKPMADGTVAIGEVGLTGEVRSVPHLERRLKEVEQLGFTRAIIPKGTRRVPKSKLELITVRTVKEGITAALQPARQAA
ncbi:MAG: DNA repair protein RadA [Candidatus Doudnabacteria bacterium]|nr:DNA repair protein RadA [Candidatus Doudnabacteria bacterium]